MGVPASCALLSAEKSKTTIRPDKKKDGATEAAYKKAKERIEARKSEKSYAKAQQKSLPPPTVRNFRDQYTIIRGWKSKKRRNSGVGGGLRDAWGIWDIAVDMTDDDQPHRTAVTFARSSLITVDEADFNEKVTTLQRLGVLYDFFCDEQDVILIYDQDPEELPPVLDAGGAITEEAAATWARKVISLLLECHSRNVFIGATALNRVVGESLADASLLGVGIVGNLVIGPWVLEDEEVGKDWLMFVAPELLEGGSSLRLGDVSDAWSVGMLLYGLLSGGPPLDSRALRKSGPRKPVLQFTPKFEGQPWAVVSPACIEFLRSLLVPDPRRRCGLSYVLNESQWLQPQVERPLTRSKTILNELSEFRERCRHFQRSSALRRAARLFAAEQLPRSSMARIEKTFRRIDKDADGLLTVEEVRVALKEHIDADSGVDPQGSKDDLEELLLGVFGPAGSADAQGIDLVEFAALLLDEHQMQQKDSLIAAFRRIDVNNTGHITKSALATALASAGVGGAMAGGKLPSELDELVSLADLNGDGQIDFEEFTRLLQLDLEILESAERGVADNASAKGWSLPVCICCTTEMSRDARQANVQP